MCHKEYDGFGQESNPNERNQRQDPESMMQSEISNLLDRLVNLKKFVQQCKDEEMSQEGIQNAIDSANKNIAIDLGIIGEIQIEAGKNDRDLSQVEYESITKLENDIHEMRNRLSYLELAKLEYKTYTAAKSEIEKKYES